MLNFGPDTPNIGEIFGIREVETHYIDRLTIFNNL